MRRMITSRRDMLRGAAGLAAFGTGVASARAAAAPSLPSTPVSLNVIDVAGQLQLTQGAMEAYAKANPKLVSHIAFSQAPAPELPGKIKAQQDAGPSISTWFSPAPTACPPASTRSCGSRSSPTTPPRCPT